MQKSIIIIGAGIAGLSAGCYGQMNGYKTRIFEMHKIPGGLCTSWKRKGYTFDGCIHWLMGSSSGALHRLYEELGAVQGRHMVDHDEFVRIEGGDDKALIFYADIDRLERHMKELAPVDTQLIEELCNTMRVLSTIDVPLDTPDQPPPDLEMDPQLLAFIEAMGKYSTISIQDTGARFSDPFLRWAFPLAFALPAFPTSVALMTLAWMHKRDAGYPIGGSLAFSRAIERRYLDLGGEVQYKARVEKILVEGDRAVGVRLADGTEHHANVVISAADGRTTIFDMLEGKYVNDTIRSYYEQWPVYGPGIYVSLGVARDLSSEPHSVTFPLKEPLTIAGEVHTRLHVTHYCYDPTLAPEGKSVIIVFIQKTNYEHWSELHKDRKRYKAEKQSLAKAVISRLEERFAGVTEQVEVVDVATPMTYVRFTGNWQGSFQGWADTTETIGKTMSRTLPGLSGFYMAGQWVYPGGGIPGSSMSGRHVIQGICERDKKSFKASVP